MIVRTTSYSEQVQSLDELLKAQETQFWRSEAKRLRDQLEAMAQVAIKGNEIYLIHQDKQVKLIPEHTAMRMSGEIP